MFVTQPTFEHPTPARLLGNGWRNWRVVELSLRLPWFIVTVWTTIGEHRVAADLLMSWERDLMQLVSESRADIAAIHYVEPPATSDSDAWRLREVRRAWIATNVQPPGGEVFVFEDAAGEFCDPLHGVLPSQLRDRTLILDRT